MEQTQSQQPSQTDEISLKDLVLFLWNSKIFIGSVTAGFMVVSVVIALLLPAMSAQLAGCTKWTWVGRPSCSRKNQHE